MASDDIRARKELLAKAIKVKHLRAERDRQSDLGERGRPGGLIHFVRYFWHVLEPNTPFVDGWVMHAICAHLEAVTRGEIKRLLINVPPGFAKSMLVNVFHPAWEWSAAGQPYHRYVTFAYASHLTERDNRRFLDVIQSPDFRELWGHALTLTSNGVTKPTNTAKGWKFSSSIDGVGTGERGSRVLCLPYSEVVHTECGPMAIGDVVANQWKGRVWSRHPSGKYELRHILKWYSNPAAAIVEVRFSDGTSLQCTPNHRIMTHGGWVAAGDLVRGELIPTIRDRKVLRQSPVCFPRSDLVDHVLADAVSGRDVNGPVVGKVDFRDDGRVLNLRPAGAIGLHAIQARSCHAPRSPRLDVVDNRRRDAELSCDSGKGALAGGDGASLIGGQFGLGSSILGAEGSVALCVRDVLRAGSVFEVAQSRVPSVPVLMPDFLSAWFGSKKSSRNKHVTHAVNSFSANSECDPWIPSVRRPRHNLAGDGEIGGRSARCAPSDAREASDAAKARNLVQTFCPDDWEPCFIQVIDVVDVGHVDETFCIEVDGNHNFISSLSYSQLSNCDDVHNIREGESEKIRSGTVQWVKEGMSNRLNDMQTDVIIGIGQRVHEDDASAAMIESGDYDHLCIPMLYDPTRHCSTSIGWEDPRTEPDELAWPERFPASVVAQIKRTLGPYAFSSQYQQSPEPRGGGILKRDWWGTYELALGQPFRHSFDFIVASLDPAFTSKEENDPSGFVVFGVYSEAGKIKIVLLHAWQKWLELHGQTMERLPTESNRDYVRRASPGWGLVEWVAHDCSRLRVHTLLIEDKASGHSVAQEIKRLYRDRDWGVRLVNPGNLDKRARAYAVQHLFADGMIEAPASIEGDLLVFRDWAQMVIDECGKFRGLSGDKDNLVDATTQAVKFLRDTGIAVRSEERQAEDRDRATHRGGARAPLYPV